MRAEAQTASVAATLRRAASALEEAGVASPRHDAERLVAFALGVVWSDLWADTSRPVGKEERDRIEAALFRRAGGEPLAYVTGSTVFYGLEIGCGPGVLVPRPETEVLVDVCMELLEQMREPVVVDVGTGTGAIAIAVARHRPDAEVFATDVSWEALECARRNALRCGAQEVTFLEGDLFDALPRSMRGRIDLVVSNPPYVPASAVVPADVLAEPRGAVFAGPRGDEVLRRIASDAPAWLSPRGAFALEFGEPWQSEVLPQGTVRHDLTGRPRVVFATSRDL